MLPHLLLALTSFLLDHIDSSPLLEQRENNPVPAIHRGNISALLNVRYIQSVSRVAPSFSAGLHREMRFELNKVLMLVGIEIRDDGQFYSVSKAQGLYIVLDYSALELVPYNAA